jgi:hypothetical protein
VLFRRALLISSLLICMLGSAGKIECSRRIKSVRPTVRFLATSWFVRGTWGRNEDRYLVEITPPRSESSSLAYLIDSYPNEAPPQTVEALNSQVDSKPNVRLDFGCDIPVRALVLRTAPGDLMAVLPEQHSFQPKLDPPLRWDEIVPCYRTMR